jgi:hypothetical protein
MSSALTRALRMRGFDVETAQELGMRGIPDEVHLQYAASQGRTLFSFNRRDYIRIHGEWLTAGRTHSGIHPSRPAETRHRLPTPWPPRHGRDSRPGRNGRLPHRNLEPRPPNTRSSDDVSPPAISGTFPPPRASVRHRLLRCRTKSMLEAGTWPRAIGSVSYSPELARSSPPVCSARSELPRREGAPRTHPPPLQRRRLRRQPLRLRPLCPLRPSLHPSKRRWRYRSAH